MTIGVVKEIKNNEFRVGLTPDAVSAFVQAGHPVLVEKGAGLGSGFPDEEYVQAGATLEDTAEAVWNKSGMIVKVKEPIECEYRFFRKDLILYTYLHLAADAPLTKALMESGKPSGAGCPPWRSAAASSTSRAVWRTRRAGHGPWRASWRGRGRTAGGGSPSDTSPCARRGTTPI